MRVKILYFAAVREIVRCDEEQVDLPPDVTDVASFVAWIAQARPALATHVPSLRIARNEEFAAGTDLLREGDVLALIPPVSGG
ncbi:MAG: molybdopterin converting factor subunit 1 [Polyangiaceae bacterium]